MRCMNPKVLVGLVALGIGIAFLAPGPLASAGPLLILLACPLSMVLMMGAMSKSHGRECDVPSDAARASAEEDDGEIARLRAEVDQLRAQVEARGVLEDRT